MEKPLLGLVALGSQPSPAITNTFQAANNGCNVTTACLMGGLSPDDVASLHDPSGKYPLFMRLADAAATPVEVPMEHFVKRLPRCLEDLLSRGAAAIAISCAADFGEIDCAVPLIVPGRLLPTLVQSLKRIGKLGIVIPNPGQVNAAYAKWRGDGFDPVVVAVQPRVTGMTLEAWADARQVFEQAQVDHVILDCFSFSDSDGQILSHALGRPVLVAREATARAIGAVVSTTVPDKNHPALSLASSSK
jgi:hypothetical protein